MVNTYLNITGGYKIPVIGLGTFTVSDEAQLETALDTALEAGYRHIDTAFVYRNEEIVGRVLKKWFDSKKLRREDVFVTTKLPGCLPPEQVVKYIKISLERLQLEYVDLYLIHLPLYIKVEGGITPGKLELGTSDIIGTWKKMEEQVVLERTRAVGVSNFNQDQIRRILQVAKIVPAVNQVELHAYLQQPELVKYCQDNGIAIVAYHPLGNPGLPAYYKKIEHGEVTVPNLFNDATIKKLAAKHGKTPAQVLLRFLIQKNIAVIPKSTTPSRIIENFAIFDFSLDSDDIRELESLDKGEKGRITWMDF